MSRTNLEGGGSCGSAAQNSPSNQPHPEGGIALRFRLLGAAGAALAAAAVMAAVAPGAQAAMANRTPSHLTHRGGYYAISSHHGTVEAVQVSFKVPAMDCKHSLGHPYYQAAWWAGAGGMGRDDSGHVVVQSARTWLEQTGVFAQCNSKTDSNPQYAPFWELVPQFDKSHSHMETYFADQGGQGAHRVKAGDRVDVTIYAPDLWPWTQDGVPGYWTFIFNTPEQNYVELHKLPSGSNPGQIRNMLVSAARANNPLRGRPSGARCTTRQKPSEQHHREDDPCYLQI